MSNTRNLLTMIIVAAGCMGVGLTRCAVADATSAPATTSQAHTAVTLTAASVLTPESLSDGQIVAIASAMDESDVEAAKLALWRSANEGTQRFAESVMNAYISMNDDLLSVARSQDIHTIESSFCEGLKGERESVKRRLATLYGSGFDREYLDAQRRGYEHELDLLDTTLIPMARNSELKAALEARRSSVFQHIRMAEQLRGG